MKENYPKYEEEITNALNNANNIKQFYDGKIDERAKSIVASIITIDNLWSNLNQETVNKIVNNLDAALGYCFIKIGKNPGILEATMSRYHDNTDCKITDYGVREREINAKVVSVFIQLKRDCPKESYITYGYSIPANLYAEGVEDPYKSSD